jgi:hypothetical protein
MNPRNVFLFARAFAAVIVFAVAALAKAPAGATDKQDSIDRLIQQLGSDDFEAREEASRKLADCDDALPKLRAAAKSEDAEVVWRAKRLVQGITRRLRDKALKELFADLNVEGIDRFIDRMVTEKDYATPQRWELAYKFAQEAAARASKLSGRQFDAPTLNLPKMDIMKQCPEFRSNDMKLQVEGIYPAGKILRQCLVVSSGDCPVTECLDNCVVFVNGDMEGCGVIRDSIVFCNGNLGNVTCVRRSMIFCTGKLGASCTHDNSVFDVLAISGVTSAKDNVYINLNAIQVVSNERNQFIQTDAGPLRLFTLFDPAMMGIELAAADGGSRVASVRAGTPFAKAGFQKGDLILRVDKTTDGSLEAIRKYLRRRVAGDEALFKVRRGDKVLELKVQFPD